MDKKHREAQEARRRQEDIALQRGLLWVVGAIVLEVLLVLLNRFYINYSLSEAGINTFAALHEALKIVRPTAAAAAVLALLWAGWQLKQGKKFALPLIAAIALAAVTICVHVAVKYRSDGMSMLYWLVIACAGNGVLYLPAGVLPRCLRLRYVGAGPVVRPLRCSRQA